MTATRWAIIAALSATLCVPTIAAVAEEPTPSFQPVTTPAAATPKPSESQASESDSSKDDSDYDIGIEGSPIDVMIDTDKTREDLESIYENPADVSLAPKLIVPMAGTSKTIASKSGSYSQFNIYQLQHGGTKLKTGSTATQNKPAASELQVIQGKTATLNSVPVNIDSALISFKTPAEDFFDGTYKGLLVLGSSAVAMLGFILIRSKRKDHSRP
jgi:hypothetical protein